MKNKSLCDKLNKLKKGRVSYNTKLALIFVSAVLFYGIWVSFFTSPVHVQVDEELYISMAKTFHYEGAFKMGGEIMNYSCVLYSMLISLAYYFYTPEHIMFLIRIIGVLCMCSSVFPIGKLAIKILNNEKTAVNITIALTMMPYMFDCAYAMQEVLSYPLFAWLIYEMFLFYEGLYDKPVGTNVLYRRIVVLSIISVLLYFTKTYMFFIPALVNLLFLWDIAKSRSKQGGEKDELIKKCIIFTAIYDVLYIVGFISMNFLIYAINDFQKGNNHYSSQITNLFPVTGKTLICGVSCCIIYMAFFVICTGGIPFVQLFEKRKKSNSAERILTQFHVYGIILLTIEIVFMIVLTEMGLKPLPAKYLFRYFQVFMPGMVILAFKISEENINIRRIAIVGEISLVVALMYFIFENNMSRNSIMDGHVFLLIENITKYIIPRFNVYISVVVMIIIPIAAFVGTKISNLSKAIIKLYTVGIVVLFAIQLVQLPLFTNFIASGSHIQKDAIEIANYLNQHDYQEICYVDNPEANPYSRNFSGYIRQDYRVVSSYDDIRKFDNKNTILVVPNVDYEIDLQNDKIAEINLELYNLYSIRQE